jgi:hypothetical protein
MSFAFKTSLPLLAGMSLGVIFAFLPSCGGQSTVDMGTAKGSGGTATLAVGGSAGAPGAGGTVTGRGGTSNGVGGDTCGGMACAEHSGPRDFVEDGVPSSAPDDFESATPHASGSDPMREPTLVYPSHETMFPINVSRIRHEWRAGGSNTLFRLRFAGPKTTVNVYTAALDWLPSAEQWDWIAEANRGEAVTLTVTGMDPLDPTNAWQSSSISLYFSASEVEGAIYYWSTGSQGVMKALVSDPVPLKFYTDPAAADSGTCVACHTLSRDGKRLAVGYGGEKLREVSVPDRSVILPEGATAGGGMEMNGKGMPGAAGKGGMPAGGGMMAGGAMASAWTTFSPDGEMLLVAANGVLTLIDSDTGAPIGANAGVVPIPSGTIATHPDWAALGDRVAITLGTDGGNKEVRGGSIAILSYRDGTWGSPEILVRSSGEEDNNFFPVWSPDSQWLAYVHAGEKSKDAVSATLRLISASGGTPILMPRLNERVNNLDGVTDIGNSMPTWAPSTRPGTFWLALSSLRAYASVRPRNDKEDQIWIAAVDPTLPDPGYAAFWAPFQNIDDGNHRAFWTHTEEDKQCGCQDECGDGLDNDCDGTADEDECVHCQPTEICGDGLDNDCDCVIDECNQEICGDGLDNDGDGAIDDDDAACAVPR